MKVMIILNSFETCTGPEVPAVFSCDKGIVSLSFTGWTAITGIVVQSDGDIDLAVTTSSGGMNVAQLNSDGSADTVFGSAGVETLSSLPAAKGIVIAPNGDLLVAGLSTATFKVAELNPSTGAQDTSYNTSGTASIVSNSNGSTVIYIGMALMPDGDLLLSGRYVTSGPPTRYYLAMVAITPAGVGDSSFGTSGGVSGRYTQEWDNPFTPGDTPMVVSPSGQIFIGYASASVGHLFLAVYGFNPNGSLNTSFGSDGIASANLSSGTTNIVLAIETNGQIVIGDGSGSGTFNLVRFNPDGTLDTTFGSSGVESGASESGGLAMVTAANGETVMVGTPPSGTTGIILQEFHTLANAQRVYVEQDADYNVTSITNTNGAAVERYEYDPYGNVTVLNPNGTVRGDGTAAASFYMTVYLHQGLRRDVETNTDDDHNRVILVSLGRPLQEDPKGYIDGPNTYQYELSSPVNSLDPSGDSSEPQPVIMRPGGTVTAANPNQSATPVLTPWDLGLPGVGNTPLPVTTTGNPNPILVDPLAPAAPTTPSAPSGPPTATPLPTSPISKTPASPSSPTTQPTTPATPTPSQCLSTTPLPYAPSWMNGLIMNPPSWYANLSQATQALDNVNGFYGFYGVGAQTPLLGGEVGVGGMAGNDGLGAGLEGSGYLNGGKGPFTGFSVWGYPGWGSGGGTLNGINFGPISFEQVTDSDDGTCYTGVSWGEGAVSGLGIITGGSGSTTPATPAPPAVPPLPPGQLPPLFYNGAPTLYFIK